MRKVIVPAYKYDEESKTLVDRYTCLRVVFLTSQRVHIEVSCKGK